jgi:hypothetical protein
MRPAEGLAELVRRAAASPRLTAALTSVGLGVGALAFPVQRLIGWPGLIAALVALLALMAVSLVVRRHEIEFQGVLPVSLLAFLGWAAISVFWSEYRWVTVGGVAYLAVFTAVGVFIALSRDTLQIVRSLGDVLRVVLAASLVLEVFAGVLIDQPIAVLGIDGRLVEGPITGLAATRNQFGLLAVIGAVTFAVELRTRSITRALAIGSFALSGAAVLFTRSPIVVVIALVVAVAAGALYLIRQLPPERRQVWQLVLLGASLVASIAAVLDRSRIIDLFDAAGQLGYRRELWQGIFELGAVNALEGWGWAGRWHSNIEPFRGLSIAVDGRPASAANAFLDVWLQVGVIGLLLFGVLLFLAFSRSWLLAGRRRSVVHVWPALILVALVLASLAESTILLELGWTVFVICSVMASQRLSWRSALRPADESGPALPRGQRDR